MGEHSITEETEDQIKEGRILAETPPRPNGNGCRAIKEKKPQYVENAEKRSFT